jgi:TolB-like protein
LVEEIITALSRIRWLFVTARNSSFAYKGQNVDVKRVGKELGVRYVLEGSVRRSRNRVRIAAQLIDAGNGAAAETARSTGRPTADLTAYDLYLRAHAMVWSARQIPEALDLLEQSVVPLISDPPSIRLD